MRPADSRFSCSGCRHLGQRPARALTPIGTVPGLYGSGEYTCRIFGTLGPATHGIPRPKTATCKEAS